jgi:hypothetical protein
MAVVWGGTIAKPVGVESIPADHDASWEALLFTIAALMCAGLIAFEGLR